MPGSSPGTTISVAEQQRVDTGSAQRDSACGGAVQGIHPLMSKHDHSRRDGPSQRQLRVGEELRHLLAAILGRHELRDPALKDAVVTVTEVRISPDLRAPPPSSCPSGAPMPMR